MKIYSATSRDQMREHDEQQEQDYFDNAYLDMPYPELAREPDTNKDQLQKLVDAKAQEAGYTTKAYHGTRSKFNIFKENSWFAIDPKDAMKFGDVKSYYLKIENAVDNTFGGIEAPLNEKQMFDVEKGEPDFVVKYHKNMHFAPVYQVYIPSHVKSTDPITYDDQGNIIPVSERFDPNNPDVRY